MAAIQIDKLRDMSATWSCSGKAYNASNTTAKRQKQRGLWESLEPEKTYNIKYISCTVFEAFVIGGINTLTAYNIVIMIYLISPQSNRFYQKDASRNALRESFMLKV